MAWHRVNEGPRLHYCKSRRCIRIAACDSQSGCPENNMLVLGERVKNDTVAVHCSSEAALIAFGAGIINASGARLYGYAPVSERRWQ